MTKVKIKIIVQITEALDFKSRCSGYVQNISVRMHLYTYIKQAVWLPP